MHPIDQIRQFTTLTPELEKKLRLIMRDRTFAKGETIHSSQMLRTGSFYITKGAARVFYTQGGREHTVSFAFSDQFVLIPHGGYSANSDTMALQFLMPSTAIFLPRMSIKTELEESGALIDLEALLFFNTALLQYTSFLEERVDVLQTLSAPERYEWAIRRFPRLPRLRYSYPDCIIPRHHQRDTLPDKERKIRRPAYPQAAQSDKHRMQIDNDISSDILYRPQA